ncbi:MAG: hypothetical protein JO323_06325, partial [Acidobacteriia bacterium]|nr:hypothetical protein [Terriglobia bacterium]
MPRFVNRWKPRGAGRQESVSVWEALGEELCAERPDPELERAIAQHRKDYPSGCAEDAPFRKLVIARLHHARSTALCFSGGGMRSATFGLGVLQG